MFPLLADHNFNFNVVRAVRRRAAEEGMQLDLITAQDIGLEDVDDPSLLEWAACNGRGVLTGDVNTLIGFAKRRIAVGQPMPGVFPVRHDAPLAKIIEDVFLLAVLGEPGEYDNLIQYLPL